MAAYDFAAPRLFVDTALASGAEIALDPAQANYLRNVLRLRAGEGVLVFNGRDGEWRATVAAPGRHGAALALGEQVRAQTPPGDLWHLFAPLKHARLDYMVQKAVEMGASRLLPVMTRRTQASRVNLARMRANAVEAAEQCGILGVPEIGAPATLAEVVAAWPQPRRLIFCDEDAPVADPLAALAPLRGQPAAVLIGPEGGFDAAERAALAALPGAVRIALGPRVLRADTAAVAALALIQAACGDWR
jgi:16S rRNA (uracil1498-N3)-methyltransferase